MLASNSDVDLESHDLKLVDLKRQHSGADSVVLLCHSLKPARKAFKKSNGSKFFPNVALGCADRCFMFQHHWI